MRSLTILSTLVVVVSTSNCGGTSLVSKDTKREEKKDDNADVSDPSVVTGAHLACELDLTSGSSNIRSAASSSRSSKTNLKLAAGESIIGCNIMASGSKLDPKPNESYKFSAIASSGATTNPQPSTSQDKYHATFVTKDEDMATTKYEAKIYTSGVFTNEAICNSNKLPCTAKMQSMQITVKTMGLWEPAQSVEKYASKVALSDKCPTNPDYFCDDPNTITKSKPSSFMDTAAKAECAGPLQTALGGIIGTLTGINLDALFDNHVTSYNAHTLNKGTECIARKRTSTNSIPALLNSGAKGCYSIMLSNNGKVRTIILSGRDVPNKAQLEAELERFACP